MGEIPGIKTPKFYERKAAVEFFTVVPPIITASIVAVLNYVDPVKRWAGWLMFGGIVWLIVASVLKVLNAYAQDKEERSKQDYDGLLGALHVLYGQISRHLNFSATDWGRLRITMHRVVPAANKDQPSEDLEQILPYIGGDGKGPGRKFSIRSGIIGKVVREKTPYAFSRVNDDYEAFIKELVQHWSYIEDDARKLTSDRQSWMGVPILGPHSSIVAVVFLDSNEKNFFSKQVQKLVINACSGIVSYIDERY